MTTSPFHSDDGGRPLPDDDRFIAIVCSRRGYSVGLFRDLMRKEQLYVTMHTKGLIRLSFLQKGSAVERWELDVNAAVRSVMEPATPWLWEGYRKDGVCVLVKKPIELLEIIGEVPELLSQVSLVVAGVDPSEIPNLISARIIRHSVLVALAAGHLQSDLHLRADVHRVKCFHGAPRPFADWLEVRDYKLLKGDRVAKRVAIELRNTVAKIVAHNLKLGLIGGVEFKIPS